MITSANIIKYLLYARHCSKHFTCINFINPQNNALRWNDYKLHFINEDTEA